MSEIKYEPQLEHFDSLIEAKSVSRVLVVGDAELSIPDSIEARQIPTLPIIWQGLFTFRKAGVSVMVFHAQGQTVGVAAALPETRLEDNHPLMAARAIYDNYWRLAEPFGRTARFNRGDYVHLVGSDSAGVVVGLRQSAEGVVYSVRIGERIETVRESGLGFAAIDDSSPEGWIRLGAVGAKKFSLTLSYSKLSNPLTDTIYAYLSSKTVFRSYQFRPVLRMLNTSVPRLLIADEVGLGKTIEAGLIWTELEQRAGLERVLIVCPASLVYKWRDEMKLRFDRELTILDKSAVRDLAHRFRAGEPPAQFAGVASLQMLRSADLMAEMADAHPDFDLVVVDEAHHLRNRPTLSFGLGSLLSDWTDALIFLSATPLNLGNSDLFNLLHLLLEDEFEDREIFEDQLAPNRYINEAAASLLRNSERPARVLEKLRGLESLPMGAPVSRRPEYEDLVRILDVERRLSPGELADCRRYLAELNTLSRVVTRTRKAEVPDARAVRVPGAIDVEWTSEERRFYDAVLGWARAKALRSGGVVGFATIMPLRQVASCIPAARSLLLEREPTLLEDMMEFEDDIAGEGDDSPIVETGDEPSDWSELAAAVKAVGTRDTKFDRFQEELARVHVGGMKQVMVFSFFRRTLAYLEDRLSRDYRVGVMHGGVKVADRQKVMVDFRAGKIDVLLLSEVGSEGLDFEFCNVIVNYDLPWNPMKVEQRIGRLDRFGQEHEKIFIFNFHVPGTVETDIFERLYKRINVFEESIGELEPILRDNLNRLQRSALDPRLSEEEREEELERVAVALAARDRQLDDLEQARIYLSGMDGLLIEGLEEDTRGKGRFVGAPEIRTIVRALIDDGTRAKLRAAQTNKHRAILIGDDELAQRVQRYAGNATGSRYRVQELARMLRDQIEIEVTFDNEDASKTGTEFISLRHPLVRTAIGHLADSPNELPRFGALTIEGDKAPRAVVFYLLRATGLQPTLEIRAVGIGLDDGVVDEDVGTEVMAALAAGRLEDAEPPTDTLPIARAVELADDHMLKVQAMLQTDRQRSNTALVDARLAAVEASFEGKIRRDEDLLAQIENDGRDERILRLYRGKISNLRARAAEKHADLIARRDLAITFWPIALALVQSRAPSTSQPRSPHQ